MTTMENTMVSVPYTVLKMLLNTCKIAHTIDQAEGNPWNSHLHNYYEHDDDCEAHFQAERDAADLLDDTEWEVWENDDDTEQRVFEGAEDYKLRMMVREIARVREDKEWAYLQSEFKRLEPDAGCTICRAFGIVHAREIITHLKNK